MLSKNTKSIRTLFMGSPEYAAIILEALLAYGQNVIGIVTQPDKRVGRGRKFKSPPVKELADKIGIECWQPNKINTNEFMDQLETLNPEIIIVAAYGKILSSSILDFPKYGCVNIHASILPRWRGASPIQAAILHGDSYTGVTIMKMDEGIDTGDIISASRVLLEGNETADNLTNKLADVGAKLLTDTISGYISGKIPLTKQDDENATYAGLIKKDDGLISFDKTAEHIERKIRAMQPWPTAFFDWDGKNVKVFSAEILDCQTLTIGERGKIRKHPCVGTKTNDLMLLELQMPGKKLVTGKVFLNGARDW